MTDTLKAFAIITAKAGLKWILVFTAGMFVSVILAIVVTVQNRELVAGGHLGILTLPWDLVLVGNFYGVVLLAGFPVFIALYFILANKMAIQTALYQAYKNKAETYVSTKAKALVESLTSGNGVTGAITNEAVVRARLLQANSNDKDSSRIKRAVINYVFKKVKLDDIDFSNKDLKPADVVVERLNVFISEKAKPSLLFFWLLMGLQFVLFALSWLKS